jgi:hypothetical protein
LTSRLSAWYSAGDVHGSNAEPSIEHWNSTVLALSLPLKRKLATRSLLGFGGLSRSNVSGAMASLRGTSPPSQRIT